MLRSGSQSNMTTSDPGRDAPIRQQQSNGSATYASKAGRAASAIKSGTFAAGMAVGSTLAYVTPHLCGAIDIMAVRQPDGSIKTSPFYVRFGKYTGSRSTNRSVKIAVNDVELDFAMHLGRTGEAYFIGDEVDELIADADLDEPQLSGICSPPSGYSSGEERPPYATAEQVVAIREAVEDISRLEQAVASGQADASKIDRLKHAADHAVEELRCHVDADVLAAAAQKEGLIVSEDGCSLSSNSTPRAANTAGDGTPLTPRSFARLPSEVFHTPAGSRNHSLELPRPGEEEHHWWSAVAGNNSMAASSLYSPPKASEPDQPSAAPQTAADMDRASSAASSTCSFRPSSLPAATSNGGLDLDSGAATPGAAPAPTPADESDSKPDHAQPELTDSRMHMEASAAAPGKLNPEADSLRSPACEAAADDVSAASSGHSTAAAAATPETSEAQSHDPVQSCGSTPAGHAPANAGQHADGGNKDRPQKAGSASKPVAKPDGDPLHPWSIANPANLSTPSLAQQAPASISLADASAPVGPGAAAGPDAATVAHTEAHTAIPATAGPAADPQSRQDAGDAAPDSPKSRQLSDRMELASIEALVAQGVAAPAAIKEAGRSRSHAAVAPADSDQQPQQSDAPQPVRPNGSATAATDEPAPAEVQLPLQPDGISRDDLQAHAADSSRPAEPQSSQHQAATPAFDSDRHALAAGAAGTAASPPAQLSQQQQQSSQQPDELAMSAFENAEQPPAELPVDSPAMVQGEVLASGQSAASAQRPDVHNEPAAQTSMASAEASGDLQQTAGVPKQAAASPARKAQKAAAAAAKRPGLPEQLGTLQLSMCGPTLRPDMGPSEAWEAFQAARVDESVFAANAAAITASPHLWVCVGERLHPWASAAPAVLGMLAFGGGWEGALAGGIRALSPSASAQHSSPSREAAMRRSSWRFWPFGSSSRKSEGATAADSRSGSEADGASPRAADGESMTLATPRSEEPLLPRTPSGTARAAEERRPKRHRRAFVPTPEQLLTMPLHDGQNTITFTFGREQERAYVHMVPWNARLVISDVDGTITKSDLLGHLLPMMSYDWAQLGITRLFHNIQENGYRMMFLSSRAIAQASATRDYLHRLNQDGHRLPSGPVIISPDGLLPSLYRELVLRRPHEFKIRCLEDIRALFPPEWNPFYAGFGNRDTDELSYLAVGVPGSKIFIINPKGELRKASSTVITSTWRSLASVNELVHAMFPPVHPSKAESNVEDCSGESEEFKDFKYWRVPPPLILDPD